MITRRKQLDRELHLHALVLDQIQEQVAVTDLAGTVTYVNRAEIEALASPKENRLGRHVSVYGDGPQADATQEEIAEATRRFGAWAGKVVNYRADGSPMLIDLTPTRWHEMEAQIVAEQIIPDGHSEGYTKEYIRKDGSVFPVELRAFLMRDKHGQPEAMWAIVRDVTERKKTEERMQLAQQIFDNASEAIFVSDLQGNLLDVNAEACRLAKYTREEMPRLRNVDIVALEETPRIAPVLSSSSAGCYVVSTGRRCRSTWSSSACRATATWQSAAI